MRIIELLSAPLRRDTRAATALEFALVFPVFLLFIFGMFSLYSLTSARRAMDFGVERALRYVAINSGTASSNVVTAYCTGAAIINGDVGSSAKCTSSAVTVSPASFTPGTWVTVTATYTWAPPAGNGTGPVPQFASTTLTSTGQVRVLH